MTLSRIFPTALAAAALALPALPVLLLPAPAMADAVSAKIVSRMKNPDAYNAHLAKLVGKWKGKGKMRPTRSLPKSSVKCSMNADWVEGGRVVKQSMTCKSFLLKVRRTSYIAYDKATRRYVGMDFGNMGPDNVTISGTGNGGRFDMNMVHYDKDSRNPKQNRLVITANGAGAMHTVMTKVSKRPYEVMNVQYHRIGGGTI